MNMNEKSGILKGLGSSMGFVTCGAYFLMRNLNVILLIILAKKRSKVNFVILIIMTFLAVCSVGCILKQPLEWYQKLIIIPSVCGVILGLVKFSFRFTVFLDEYPLLKVDSIKVGPNGKYWISLENYAKTDSISNLVTFLRGRRLSNYYSFEPLKGGGLFTKGVRRGPWLKRMPFLDPVSEGDQIVARVFTKSVDGKKVFCTCGSFISQNGDWHRGISGRNTEPYFFRFSRCKNCPFEKKEIMDTINNFSKNTG